MKTWVDIVIDFGLLFTGLALAVMLFVIPQCKATTICGWLLTFVGTMLDGALAVILLGTWFDNV